MKTYPVSVEISGPVAMFTRPDTGSSFVSYPAPTFSACTAIFASVARLETAYIKPTKVNICRPVIYHRYYTNYNGPLRKDISVKKGNPYQYPLIVLTNVCYQIFGEAQNVPRDQLRSSEYDDYLNTHNNRHHIQELFNRRLKQGRLFSTPFLGQKEFVPDYFGPIRSENKPLEEINETIPSMLFTVFDRIVNGDYHPVFRQNVKIEKGVLDYAQ